MEFIEKYKVEREDLLNKAEALIGEGKLEESKEIMANINTLDVDFEAKKLELANLQALKGENKVSELQNYTVNGDVKMTNVSNFAMGGQTNEVLAFGKLLKGEQLTASEMSNVVTTSNGAVAIPESLLNEVIGLVSEQYPLFGDARKFEVKGLLKLPKHKAIVSGDAQAYAEDVQSIDEENTFAQVSLGGVEVAKYINVTFKLEAMSIPAFVEYLRGELVARVGALVGTMVYTGVKANGQFEGAVAVAVTAGQVTRYATGGQISYDNIADSMGKLASQFVNGSAVYANSQTVWGQLAKIKDLDGRPIFISNVANGGVGTIFGLPVKVDGGAPDGTIVIANAREAYAINTNEAITLESDRNLKARTTEFLAHGVMDGAVINEKALVVIAPQA